MKKKTPLNEILRDKRLAAGLTQKEVALKFGYSTSQFISNWERGISYPPYKILKQVAEIYQIPMHEYFELLLEVEIEAARRSLHHKFANI